MKAKQVDIKDILYTISTWQSDQQKIKKVQEALDRINKPKLVT